MSSADCPFVLQFSADDKGYPWQVFGILGGLIAVGLLMFAGSRVPSFTPEARDRLSGWSFPFLAGGIGLLVLIGGYVAISRHNALHALRSPNTPVVEGHVTNLREHPDSRDNEKEFDVAGVHFGYSTGEAYTPGFNKSRSAGGPIREGLPVRITYSGDRKHASILKLEVRTCSAS